MELREEGSCCVSSSLLFGTTGECCWYTFFSVNMLVSEWQVHGLLTWRWEADVPLPSLLFFLFFFFTRKKLLKSGFPCYWKLFKLLAMLEFKAVSSVMGSFKETVKDTWRVNLKAHKYSVRQHWILSIAPPFWEEGAACKLVKVIKECL